MYLVVSYRVVFGEWQTRIRSSINSLFFTGERLGRWEINIRDAVADEFDHFKAISR